MLRCKYGEPACTFFRAAFHRAEKRWEALGGADVFVAVGDFHPAIQILGEHRYVLYFPARIPVSALTRCILMHEVGHVAAVETLGASYGAPLFDGEPATDSRALVSKVLDDILADWYALEADPECYAYTLAIYREAPRLASGRLARLAARLLAALSPKRRLEERLVEAYYSVLAGAVEGGFGGPLEGVRRRVVAGSLSALIDLGEAVVPAMLEEAGLAEKYMYLGIVARRSDDLGILLLTPTLLRR